MMRLGSIPGGGYEPEQRLWGNVSRECELSISYLMDELSRNLTLPSRARTRAALDFGDISRPCIVCLCHLRRDAMAVMMYVTRERNISAVLPRGRDYQK